MTFSRVCCPGIVTGLLLVCVIGIHTFLNHQKPMPATNLLNGQNMKCLIDTNFRSWSPWWCCPSPWPGPSSQKRLGAETGGFPSGGFQAGGKLKTLAMLEGRKHQQKYWRRENFCSRGILAEVEMAEIPKSMKCQLQTLTGREM